jgi:hypothetical protein
MQMMARALCQLGVIGFACFLSGEVVAKPPPAAVHAHYVVLGQAPGTGATVAMARVILELGYACPKISGPEAEKIQMLPRRNPHHFPVMVCEASIGFSEGLAIELDGVNLTLPDVKKNPKRIAVFGDTGCKPTKTGELGGCPPDSPAKPFQSLAQHAASSSDGKAPDLVLHMGDANYRGTSVHVLFPSEANGLPGQKKMRAYDAGDHSDKTKRCDQSSGSRFVSQNQPDSSFPDSWKRWRDDFFAPARDLLAAAPWVIARGNHELCSRAGPGWFTFLDPSSDWVEGGRQLSCPRASVEKDPIDNVVLSEPYAVDLSNLRLVVLDSANACDDSAFPGPFTEAYEAQMARLSALTDGADSTWLISHRPIWAVKDFRSAKDDTGCTEDNAEACINQTLQAALDRGADGALPSSVKLVLSGHMHRFQSVTFSKGDRPPTIVVGTGGTQLDAKNRVGGFEATVQGVRANVLTTAAFLENEKTSALTPAFGYLSLDYLGGGAWRGKLTNPALHWADCGSDQAEKGSVCALANGVKAWGRSE